MNIQQYGFRPNRSTEDIITQSLFYIDTYSSLNKKVASASLDVEKAFDTVWHKGLHYKLFNHYNMPIITKKLLAHFTINREYTALHRNSKSHPFTSKAGVPQGSAISPTLFAIYTNDMPTPINEKSLTLLYADDITILTYHKDRWGLRRDITQEISNIETYQSTWLMKTNKNKSNIVLYKQHMLHVQGEPVIRINEKLIPYTDSTKILGVEFDNKLTFKKHIDHRIHLVKYTKSKLTRFKTLKTKLHLYLFNTLVLPQILFSITPILYSGIYGINKIQVIQNKTLRGIFCIKWNEFIKNTDIHAEHHIEQISSKIHKRFNKHFDK